MHLDKKSIVLKGHGRLSLEVSVWNLQSFVADMMANIKKNPNQNKKHNQQKKQQSRTKTHPCYYFLI